MSTRSLQNPRVTLQISSQVRNVLLSGTVVSGQIGLFSVADTLTSGISVSEANRGWELSQTLVEDESLTIDVFDFVGIDLGAGDGNDLAGQVMTPIEEIVAIGFLNNNANGTAGRLEVIPDPTNGWDPIGSHTIATGGALRAGGALVKYQPDEQAFNVTDGQTNRIKITAREGSVAVIMTVIGRHDDDESSSSSLSSSSSSVSSSSSSSSESTSSESTSSSSISTSSSSQSVSSSSSQSSSSSSISTSSISTSSVSTSSSSLSTSSLSSFSA